MINGKNVYKFRKLIRQLYDNSTNLSSDLIDLITDNLSKYNKKISKIDFKISDYNVTITLVQESVPKDFSNIISNTGFAIRDFILNNLDNINDIDSNDKEEFEKFVHEKLLFEVFVIGKNITFQL